MGSIYVMFMANLHFANNFVAKQDQTFYIKGNISSVVVKKEQSHSVTFTIKLDEIDGMPVVKKWYLPATHVRVNWFKPKVQIQQGDELLATVKLSKPHGYQNTFGFDYNQWIFAKQFVATGNIKTLHSYLSNSQLSNSHRKHPVKNTQQLTTNKLIDATAGFTHQGIILAVGLGNRSLITAEQFESYNHMGISHLLAISGLHIGIIFLFMKLLLKWLANLLRIYISYICLHILVLLLLWAYITLIDFPISATRAALFVTLWIILNISFTNINKIKLLLIVALFSLLIEPFSVLTAAWWLTFSAVVGIIVFTQKYPLPKSTKTLDSTDFLSDERSDEPSRLNIQIRRAAHLVADVAKRAGKKLFYLIKFQIFITIWMMPVVIFWFGGVSLSGVLTNLIAIPLFSFLLVPCIFLGTVFVMLSDVIVSFSDFSYLLSLSDKVLTYLLDLFSHYKVFHFWLNIAYSLWFYVLLLISLLLVLPVYIRRNPGGLFKPTANPKFLTLLLTAILFIPIMLSLLPWQTINKDDVSADNLLFTNNIFSINKLKPRLTMYVLDVGQGTSILFQQGRSGFIYDLGPVYPSGFNATQAVVKPMLVGLGITDVDHIVISHNDSDHIGNIAVLGNDKWVEQRLLNCPTAPFNWLNIKVEVLWPPFSPPALSKASAKNDINKLSKNDSSCVVKITDEFTGISVLLTGDITSKIERRLLVMAQNNTINLTSDILISAHHGSKYSSAMTFINAVAPVKVVHSAGVNNRFGFPTKEVINRFNSFKTGVNMEQIQQYSTNKLGMIKVEFNNNIVSDNNDDIVTGYLNHWQPFWKKQNPFRFTSEIR